MQQSNPLTKSVSTTEISDVHPLAARAQTPGPEERFTYAFKSLFTLADVAAKRRANGSVKKLLVQIDENQFDGGEAAGTSAFLKRSKSSGDVVVLGEKAHILNAAAVFSVVEESEAGVLVAKPVKGLRSRAATTPSTPPSKIPKAKSPSWIHPSSSSTQIPGDISSVRQGASAEVHDYDPDALKVDDAVFVMLTPPKLPEKRASKNLKLAAHVPSLPKVASPFSPRINQPSAPESPSRHARPRASSPGPPSPGTGHTNASLHLTKSHWEVRYEAWLLSVRSVRPRRPVSVRTEDETSVRSRFPEPLTNPALFPRAGSLTPKALRPVLEGLVLDDDARPALELDWAMRAWPMDKIQRALFVHDMDIRVWFPVGFPSPESTSQQGNNGTDGNSELELTRVPSVLEDDEREKEMAMRKWEWDWELRWRVIESMADEDGDRTRSECEYDVFLAEEDGNYDGNYAYGGCEMGRDAGDTTWEWNEDAMEVDAIL